MMFYIAYYLTGFVGATVVLAGSFSMMMRIWDGVTNPFVDFISIVLTGIAVFSIMPKDNIKYFGTGQAQRVTFKDYADVLKHNRGIQMLVLSVSTSIFCSCSLV